MNLYISCNNAVIIPFDVITRACRSFWRRKKINISLNSKSLTCNKYIITKNTRNPLGYKLLKETDELALYLNELALPIGYSNNNLMSLEEYSSLSYPYNLEALINYIVVDKEIKSNYKMKGNL